MKAAVSNGSLGFTQLVRSKTQLPALRAMLLNTRQRYPRKKGSYSPPKKHLGAKSQ